MAVVDSKGPMKFGEFIEELVGLGAEEALYLDMGGWSYSWYRDAEGKPVEIHPVPNPYGTNWITFYR